MVVGSFQHHPQYIPVIVDLRQPLESTLYFSMKGSSPVKPICGFQAQSFFQRLPRVSIIFDHVCLFVHLKVASQST